MAIRGGSEASLGPRIWLFGCGPRSGCSGRKPSGKSTGERRYDRVERKHTCDEPANQDKTGHKGQSLYRASTDFRGGNSTPATYPTNCVVLCGGHPGPLKAVRTSGGLLLQNGWTCCNEYCSLFVAQKKGAAVREAEIERVLSLLF